MNVREAPGNAVAKLPPGNWSQKAVADATALPGAFGAHIFKAAEDIGSCAWTKSPIFH
jgi:hypothetical protein